MGPFITKGMTVSIPKFEISFNKKGEPEGGEIIIHTGLDMCPYWIEIACTHLKKTDNFHKQLISANNDNNDSLMGELLQNEFNSGMQAIMAGCIAIDSYYTSIKSYGIISREEATAWRENKTARYAQIAETLKKAFYFPEEHFQKMREVLEQCFKLRDNAIHPKYGTEQPVLYPEINKHTDWRFSAFRYANAKAAVASSLSIIYQTANQKKNKNKELKNYCENLVKKLDPILSKWEQTYGELFG